MILNTKIIEKLGICGMGYSAALLSGYEHDTDIELDDLCSMMESNGYGLLVVELKEIIENKRYAYEDYTVSKYFVFDGHDGQHVEFNSLEEAKEGQIKIVHKKIMNFLDIIPIQEECKFADGATQLKKINENLPEYTLEFVESVISSTE